MQIESTKKYEIFSLIKGNRNINQKKIDRICDEITNGLNLLPYCPIIVHNDGKSFMIVDGQHRYTVSVRLELPVYYVVCDQLTLQQIATLNGNMDKWKASDFLQCYIEIGNKEYETLKQVVDKYKVSLSTAVALLSEGKVREGSVGMKKFKDGSLKIKHYDFTIQILDLLTIFDAYTFGKDRRLIMAIETIFHKGLIDWNVLREKISAAPMLMNKNASPKAYCFNIEQVYNYHNRDRQVII